MRIPLSWVREFTALDAPVDAIVAALNQLGLEVEGVEEPGAEIGGVVVAEVLDVMAHPDADKLRLVDIDFGLGQTRVVCGAPNVDSGMHVAYAGSGSTLPGGIQLEARKIRGVVSDGMLCSAAELALGDDHGGILDLGADAVLGLDVRELLGLDDVVLDLAITPNRPDAMCVVGVARELAAHFRTPLVVPEPVVPTSPAAVRAISVVVEAPERCPRYLAWTAMVAVGPSPGWMQQRLLKAGMRPISNVVDVTNYVLLERNQPLHAFDLAHLAGPGIVVRLAEAGERMTTLDGVERMLAPDDLLICDANRAPQALAGIMGGRDSEISATTTEVMLEAAYFERMGIARSSKRLKVRSESSARFERGIDPDAVATSAARAMELLVAVAGATVAPEAIDDYPSPAARPTITLRTSKVNGVLGTALADTEVLDALRPLGIDVKGKGDKITAVAPSFRPDLEREIDLVEEVARRIGFDAIGRTVPRPRAQVGGLTRGQRERRLVADALVGAGFSEAVTLPLVADADLESAGAPRDTAVRAANPLRAEESVLRTRILPGLLRAAGTNAARGLGDVVLFELGRVFIAPPSGQLLPIEPTHVAGVLAGQRRRRPVEADRPVDGYDVLDAVRAVLDALEIVDVRFVAAPRPGFRPGALAIEVSGTDVGTAGELDSTVVDAFGLAAPAAAFELDLDVLSAAPRRDRAYRAPSSYPPAVIDLAFVLDHAVAAAEVLATLRAAGTEMLEAVFLFDEFRSETLGHQRSLAFRLRYRAADRTLTDRDVAGLRQAAIDAVTTTHKATLRA